MRPVHALVTGASSGIGYELAKLLAADGYPLVLVARSGDRLQAIGDLLAEKHGIAVEVCRLDLADPNSAEGVLEFVNSRSLPIEVLVNNAGFGTFGPFAENDADAVSKLV